MYDPKNNLISSVDMNTFTINNSIAILKEFSDTFTIVKEVVINIDKREFGSILITQVVNDVHFQFITLASYEKRYEFIANILTSSENITNLKGYPQCFSFPLKNLRFLRHDEDMNGSFVVLSLYGDEILPSIYFKDPNDCAELLKEIRAHLVIQKSINDDNLYIVKLTDTATLERSLAQLNLLSNESNDIVKRFVKSPQSAALTEFAKLTTFMRDTIVNPLTTKLKKHRETPAVLESSKSTTNEGVIAPFIIQPCTEELINVSMPVGPSDLCKLSQCEHCRPDVNYFKSAIFMNGLSSEVRAEFWKYLTGFFPWDASEEMKMSISKERTDKYFKMKSQWVTMLDEQKERNSYFSEMKQLIGQDVDRIDHSDDFYQIERNVQSLHDILVTFVIYNHDAGYVQGMCDILSVILAVMDNEVDAFWCFANLMDKMKTRFEIDQGFVLKQLSNLQLLIKFIDRDFADFLTAKNSINMYFCFRWLIVLFRREFTLNDCMVIWDVLLTELPCKRYELFLCLAILLDERNTIISNDFSFDDILKHINDLALKLNVKHVLNEAFSLYTQLSQCANLPTAILDILNDE